MSTNICNEHISVPTWSTFFTSFTNFIPEVISIISTISISFRRSRQKFIKNIRQYALTLEVKLAHKCLTCSLPCTHCNREVHTCRISNKLKWPTIINTYSTPLQTYTLIKKARHGIYTHQLRTDNCSECHSENLTFKNDFFIKFFTHLNHNWKYIYLWPLWQVHEHFQSLTYKKFMLLPFLKTVKTNSQNITLMKHQYSHVC